jgi:hypothetical protein
MSQAVQHIIDANAPMVFTYAHSRPKVQRVVYPTGITGETVSTIDAETGKYKKFKLDGIIFPTPPVDEWISYSIDQGLTVSFNYRYSNPDLKRIGVPIKLSKNGQSVLVKLSDIEEKYFKISGIENLHPVPHVIEEVEESVEEGGQFPDWIMNTDWSHNLEEEEPLEVELIDLSPYLRVDGSLEVSDDENEVSDDENDPDYEPSDDECETTDEEYLPSEDDDEKSTDDEVVYEEEGVRITKKMVEEERAKIQKNLERNKELKEAYNNILYNAERNRRECTGCKYGIMNQKAHYNGCLGDDDEY